MAFASDASLVNGLRKKNPHAAVALYERYASYVGGVLGRVLGPDQELGDLLGDVFLNAFETIGTLRDDSKLRAWLAGIAVNRARDLIRKRRTSLLSFVGSSRDLSQLGECVEIELDEIRRAKELYKVLDRVPVDERIALLLRYGDGCTVAEIVEICAISTSTAKRRIEAGRSKFIKIAQRHPFLATYIEEFATGEVG